MQTEEFHRFLPPPSTQKGEGEGYNPIPCIPALPAAAKKQSWGERGENYTNCRQTLITLMVRVPPARAPAPHRMVGGETPVALPWPPGVFLSSRLHLHTFFGGLCCGFGRLFVYLFARPK